jgi:predicted nucleotide-binding protein (sugar kinase/HSP70/actin superfamily)
MSAAQTDLRPPSGGPLVELPLIADPIQAQLAQERERLRMEAGLAGGLKKHFKRPVERAFTKAQRANTTVLFGGLTVRHDNLLMYAMRGLGYKVELMPVARKVDFQAGKEYGNNGQCNPTYFTVGNLVNVLKDMRDNKGIPTERILNDYVFFTAGTCGPCRFGMYEAEYRLALQNSGFDGFRVLLFDQSSGIGQESAIDINLSFLLALLNGLFLGDLMNEVAYHIRPYEVVPGSTNAVFEECLHIMQQTLESKNGEKIKGGFLTRMLSKIVPGLTGPDDVAKLLDQFRGDTYHAALRKCRDLINERVEVDYTKPKPIVKVTGEFWAQTTEGEGNFKMFQFLEGEGAQVLVEPIGTWVNYLLHFEVQYCKDRKGLNAKEAPPAKWDIKGRLRRAWRYRSTLTMLSVAEKLFIREFERLRNAFGGTAHKLVDQNELEAVAHKYYHTRAEGGEGHMEVAKAIYYASHHLTHMVLSLKPFGCMPSTQSDGAQAAVVSHYPDLIYLPIETSGEGDINAYSRVQMALGEAKVKCKQEFAQCVGRTGYSLEQIQAFVAEHRELRKPIQQIPHHEGVVGQAANFVLHVAKLMKAAGVETNAALVEESTVTEPVKEVLASV